MQTHLYRRGATYYWRRLVPTAFQGILGCRDLRTSLRTNIPETARSRARQMDTAFDLALAEMEQIVRSGQVLSAEVKRRLVAELRDAIIDKAEDQRLMGGIRSRAEIEVAVANMLKWQSNISTEIAQNNLARGFRHADPLLAREGIDLDRNGQEYRRFAKDVLVGMADAFGIVADREQGIEYDPDGPRPVKVVADDESDGIRTADQKRNDNANLKKPFSEHAQAFLAQMKASWSKGQFDDAKKAIALFLEFVGDKPVGHYGNAEAVFYVGELRRMPIGVGKDHPYRDISATDAIKLADEIENRQLDGARARIKSEKIKGAAADRLLLDARVRRLSVVSQIKYRDPCNAVFKYLQELLNVNLKNPFFRVRPKKKGKSDVRKDREKYSDAQIQRIFASPIWTGCKTEYYFVQAGSKIFKNEKYWVPAIACVMGMRLEEICQLWIADIVERHGIWCIDIWEGPERQLKNAGAARVIPIPDVLINLGLLKYAKKLKTAGEYRLFPTLKRSTNVDERTGLGKLGPSLTRSLGRYFEIHELADPGQLFHSFRHSFATKLDETDVPMKAISDLMGHLQDGSESQRRYVKRAKLLKFKEYMDRVNFGLQFVEVGGDWHYAKPAAATLAAE